MKNITDIRDLPDNINNEIDTKILKFKYIKMEDCLNDLWLTVSFYISGYPFDEDHQKKHELLIKKAQVLLGIPENLEDLINKESPIPSEKKL